MKHSVNNIDFGIKQTQSWILILILINYINKGSSSTFESFFWSVKHAKNYNTIYYSNIFLEM